MMERHEGRQRAGETRLQAYLDAIAAVLGHAGRTSAMRAYCTGLLLPGGRKNIELMAARVSPGQVRATHQSMHHVVAKAQWDDAAVLGAVLGQVLPALERRGPVRTWMVDTIAFPKQGSGSVGVARQPCGRAGKQDNCQVAVSLSVANEHASLSIAYRLYLPQTWADDPVRRSAAGVPWEVGFETKAAIALGQLRRASAAGVPPGVVLGGAEYGGEAGFRSGVGGLGLHYALAVPPSTSLQSSGEVPRGLGYETVSAKALALSLSPRTWRREGRTGLSSRFAAIRVRPTQCGIITLPGPEDWLLVEWPVGDAEPAEYWFSNLPPHTALRSLVRTVKEGGRIKRDSQELRQSIGLGHYEGRGWRGFHHHASLCIAAYGFLVADRCSFPSMQRFAPDQVAVPEQSQSFRPRGSAEAARAQRQVLIGS